MRKEALIDQAPDITHNTKKVLPQKDATILKNCFTAVKLALALAAEGKTNVADPEGSKVENNRQTTILREVAQLKNKVDDLLGLGYDKKIICEALGTTEEILNQIFAKQIDMQKERNRESDERSRKRA